MMSHTENVQCSVDIAVMDRVAFVAHPFSDPKTFSTFWAADCAATGTGLGCEVFRDLTVDHFPRNRFIGKQVFEHRPARIIHGFSHVRFCQFGTTDISNDNQLTFFRESIGFFMQKILASIRNLGLQITRLPGTALTLMFRNPSLLIPIPARRFNLAAIGTGRQRFQPQINTDLFCSRRGFRFRHFNHEVNVPALTRILAETAAFDRAGKFATLPESEGVTGIMHSIVNDLDTGCFERNPPRRSFPAPAQFALFELLATGCILFAHSLHGLGMQAQFLAAAGRQLAQVLIGRPALIPAQRVFLRLVAEVPNLITRSRQAVERWHSGRILDPVAVGAYHVVNDNTHYNRNQHDQRNFTHENQPGTQRATSETGRTGRTQFIESGAKSSVRLCHAQRSRTAFGALCIPALNGGAFRARLGNLMYSNIKLIMRVYSVNLLILTGDCNGFC